MAVEDELERLRAEGKITEADFARLTGLANSSAAPREPPPPLPGPPPLLGPPPLPPAQTAYQQQSQSHLSPASSQADQPSPGEKSRTMAWVISSIVGFILISAFFAWISARGGLSIGSLNSDGREIQFKLANDSRHGGDVLITVRQGEITSMCEHVVAVDPHQVYNVRFICSSLQNGFFEVAPMWAEMSTRASVAQRIVAQ